MNPRKIGSPVPSVTFRVRDDAGWSERTSDDIFHNRTVVLFSLPGAFTPTCSGSQVPGYNALAGALKAQGVDEIVCMSVNDAFVMRQWQQDQNAHNLTFLADGNGEFTDAMGLLVDRSDLGFGPRSWRYSMLVKDGVITQLFIEPQKTGDPYEVSDPETMLAAIDPDGAIPPAVTMISRDGCEHCTRAKAALAAAGMAFEEIKLGGPVTNRSLQAITGVQTTPQVFVDGQLIGTADALEAWLKEPAAA